ncbi:MAG TPA: choice-of-anchor tandem repeat GloVer-containing protein [Candidatus Sulfotelmatobacter sp.]
MKTIAMRTLGSFGAVLAVAAITFILAVRAQAQTESVIYSFSGGSDGANPSGSLVADARGNLYGTTFSGGDLSGCGGTGCGGVFKLSPSSGGWTETVLHSFTGGGDGSNPPSGVIFDSKGNLYGVASAGGKSACQGGCGVVFQLSPTSSGWKEKPLYTFGGGTDGFSPFYQLAFDAAGNLYGTTLAGGNLVNCASHTFGCGVAFRLTHESAGWQFRLLYNFTDSDSSSPSSGLILDGAGNLYGSGTAGRGGVVYQLSPAAHQAWKDTVLYTFDIANGYLPQGLTFDAAGNLYGPTSEGGTGGSITACQDERPGCGTAFKLSHSSSGWSESVLHNFTGQDADPNGSLVFDAAGNLYGADMADVFKLLRGSNGVWKKAVLHTFGGTGDGSGPRGPVLLDKAGDVFGVTYSGGFSGLGTVFEITP